MSWLYEKRAYPSQFNELITAERILGTWSISVGKREQTGPATDRLWRHAFKRYRDKIAPEPRILVTGFGAGGAVRDLYRLFPGCKITAIEYDPVMVNLAKKIHLWGSYSDPTILIGNAQEVLATITERFDLIILDIFKDNKPSPALTNDVFLHAVSEHIQPGGTLLVNVCTGSEYLQKIRQLFPIWETWKRGINYFAAASHEPGPYEPFVDPRNYDVTPPELWREYGAIAGPAGLCAREQLELGAYRWSLWPIAFEQHTGDTEPKPRKKGALNYNRLVMWRRITDGPVPHGWQISSASPWRIDAFAQLEANQDYTALWHKKARHDVRRWREEVGAGTYKIEELDWPTFSQLYQESTAKQRMGAYMLRILKRKLSMPESKDHIVFWGVRDMKKNELIAGTAVIYSPTTQSSVRECPCMRDSARSTHAMTGLMDHWYQESLRRGIRTQYFTYFWHPGQPDSWKGFSRFKSHFAQFYIAYPPELTRFVRGKLF